MGGRGLYIDAVINKVFFSIFVDSGCLCLVTISPRAATRFHATILPIIPRPIAQVINDLNPPSIAKLALFSISFGGLTERLLAYVIPG